MKTVPTLSGIQRCEKVQLCMNMSLRVYDNTIKHCVYITGLYDGQAMIHETKCGRLVIAFRGTESLTDCIVNMWRYKSRLECVRGAYVHAGFLAQHSSTWDQIIEHLSPYMNAYKEILVTGHSLGGALATLFSVRFACLYPGLSVSCYTFGSPRVGNILFVKRVQYINNLSILRVNNENDITTWIPWSGFVHTSKVVNIPVYDLSWYEYRKRHSIERMNSAFTKCM